MCGYSLLEESAFSPRFLEVVFSRGHTDTCLWVIQPEPKSAIQEMSLTKIAQWKTHKSRVSYVTPLLSWPKLIIFWFFFWFGVVSVEIKILKALDQSCAMQVALFSPKKKIHWSRAVQGTLHYSCLEKDNPGSYCSLLGNYTKPYVTISYSALSTQMS